MKFFSRKKAQEQAPVPSLPAAETPPAIVEEEEKKPDSAGVKAALLELMEKLEQEQSPAGQEVKLLRSVFSKASRAVLEDAAMVDDETVGAFVSYARNAGNTDLQEYAVSRLGAIAVGYPEYADTIIASLEGFLGDNSADIRHAAVFSLGDIGRAHSDKAGGVLDILCAATGSSHTDLRIGAVSGITTLGVLYEDHAEKGVGTLVGVLARKTEDDPAMQPYAARIKSAQSLGEIALAHESVLDKALEGLAVALQDENFFVQHRAIDAMLELGLRHDAKKDWIIERLDNIRQNAVFAVSEKAGKALSSLRPPAQPEKTPREIAEDRKKEQEQNDKAAFALWKKQESDRRKTQEEREKKKRMESIKKLANTLPGAKI